MTSVWRNAAGQDGEANGETNGEIAEIDQLQRQLKDSHETLDKIESRLTTERERLREDRAQRRLAAEKKARQRAT